MSKRRVVVTGMGALTPIGNGVSEFWESLISGVSGAANITYFDASKFKTKFACEIKGYNPEDYFERKEARKMDRFTQYALVSVDEAINEAVIPRSPIRDNLVRLKSSQLVPFNIFRWLN